MLVEYVFTLYILDATVENKRLLTILRLATTFCFLSVDKDK